MLSVRAILLGILIVGTAFMAWHYKSTMEENRRLRSEISAANRTIRQLDAKMEAEAEITRNTDNLLEEIRNAPESDDAPVAPVLDRTIDRLQQTR